MHRVQLAREAIFLLGSGNLDSRGSEGLRVTKSSNKSLSLSGRNGKAGAGGPGVSVQSDDGGVRARFGANQVVIDLQRLSVTHFFFSLSLCFFFFSGPPLAPNTPLAKESHPARAILEPTDDAR